MTKEVCVENLDWVEIPHSFLCMRIHHIELWLYFLDVFYLFHHHTHAKPPFYNNPKTKLANLLESCHATEAHDDDSGHTQAGKVILIYKGHLQTEPVLSQDRNQ